MAKTRVQKEELLARLDKEFAENKAVFVDYKGLSVSDIETLRNRLNEKGVSFSVVKNSLVKIALKNNKIEVEREVLSKPIAIAFGSDEVTPSKEIATYAKENDKVEILGGVIENKFVPESTIKALSMLPSKEELYAKVVGSIASPLSGLVNVMAGNIRGLVNVLGQYRDSKN